MHTRWSWAAYIGQAGVTLGLARKVQHIYPEWGAEFATMVVSVVSLNQIMGPVAMRLSIRAVGEHRLQEAGEAAAEVLLFTRGPALFDARTHGRLAWRVAFGLMPHKGAIFHGNYVLRDVTHHPLDLIQIVHITVLSKRLPKPCRKPLLLFR